jgi:murein DD-endopeptidase MepM/ murein hydrolase activator NlpD
MAVAISTALQFSPVSAGSIDFKAPFACRTTYVGSTYPGHSKDALDFNQPGGRDKGDPVLASAAGRVIELMPWDGMVILGHAGGYQTVYAHMTGIRVRVGESVGVGTLLGHIGAVGNATGPHLHYQQLIKGSAIPVRFDHKPYRLGSHVTSTNCAKGPPPPPGHHHKHKHHRRYHDQHGQH